MESDFRRKYDNAIEAIRDYFCENEIPWIVGFSGGKDSSLVIKLIFSALKDLPRIYKKPIHVFYCDTGVEIPVLDGYIKKTLREVKSEGIRIGLDISVDAIRPLLKDRYFVKVLGRGYPPPSNKFRWCTDRLRIDPIQNALRKVVATGESIVVLGARYNESIERDRILSRNSKGRPHLFKQSGRDATTLFCPISEFDTDDVWLGLAEGSDIECIDLSVISNLYKSISGECPIIRLPNTNPCSKGRFGCWTCTVIRQDKATTNLIASGYVQLAPLLEFRNWMVGIRDDVKFRCTIRRNGMPGLGPFRLSARKELYTKLLAAEAQSGFKLISPEEVNEINKLWLLDEESTNYKEDVGGLT
ncbi:DNA sulfur modification protein DndC [Pseudomonas sp. AG1028]|uniref:phosphoadenosine phosphosulfate reductase domain-containing protein n=1 Tax=Pseudomonas sp. AG1028 TaxID=2572911 RepID=UPI0011ABD60E|nr:phosphoadenosine phosphosulfate reductase family protein [Pseudomonas sp. AG1028]TWE05939.1 DNA sulfur modification protein DndC [Pseudomonas sp. AG1028]